MLRSLDKVEARRQVHGEVHARRSRSRGSSTCWPTRWRWPSSPRSAWTSSATSRSAESVIGTGPWMLDCYRPNQGMTLVRNPAYFVPGPALHRPDRGRPSTRTTPPACRRSWPASTTSAGSSPAPSTGRTGCRSRTRLKQRPEPPHRRVPVQRHEPHLDAHRPEAVQRRPRAPGHVAGHRPPGHHRRDRRGRRRAEPAGAGRAQGLVDPDRPARRGREVLTSTIPPRPSGCWRRPATRTASRARSASRPTAPRCWSTACSSC